jgi:subtilisin family serine protease
VLVVLRKQADLSGADALSSKEARGRYVQQALRLVAETTQPALIRSLEEEGIDYQSYYVVNALRIQVDTARLRVLSSRSDVARIVPNPWVQGISPDLAFAPIGAAYGSAAQSVEPNLLRVHADDVWAMGITGQGAVVAGQDTGYDWDHPALMRQYRGWDGAIANHDYNWHDAIHEDNPNTPPGNICGFDSLEPCDDQQHGTHTMGTIVGDDGATNQIGMAPGSRWIGCRNMEQGWGTPATYLECFEFFLAPYPIGGTPAEGDTRLAPHVVNNSWSCPPAEGCDPGVLQAAVRALRQAGILVVTSGGNEGPACGSMRNPPALYPESLSVAAFSHVTDQIASFSNRGPVSFDGNTYTKPDIAAPGQGVRSSIPGGNYGYSSGTSMAAPHVAGAAALLVSAAPGHSGDVDAIVEAMSSFAETRLDDQCGPASPPNSVWGWGILDALASVNSVAPSRLQGTVTDATNDVPIADAVVQAIPGAGPDRATTSTDELGAYVLALEPGTYDVTAVADGYAPSGATGIVITSEQAITLDLALSPRQLIYLPAYFLAPSWTRIER